MEIKARMNYLTRFLFPSQLAVEQCQWLLSVSRPQQPVYASISPLLDPREHLYFLCGHTVKSVQGTEHSIPVSAHLLSGCVTVSKVT